MITIHTSGDSIENLKYSVSGSFDLKVKDYYSSSSFYTYKTICTTTLTPEFIQDLHAYYNKSLTEHLGEVLKQDFIKLIRNYNGK